MATRRARGWRRGQAPAPRIASLGLVHLLAAGLLVLSGPPAHAAADPWSPVDDSGTAQTLIAVAVLDPEDPDPEDPDPEEALPVVVAVGGGGTVVRSEDGGETWESITVPPPPGKPLPALRDVHFPSPTTGYAVGGGAASSDGAVYKTEDGGRTWSLSATFGDLSLYGVWFTSPDTGHAVGQGGVGANTRILRTTDGGQTWEVTLRDDLGKVNNLRAVSFFDTEVGVAVGGPGPFLVPGNLTGLIVRTQDGGETWDPVTLPGTEESRHIQGPLRGVWAIASGSPGQRPAYAVGNANGTGLAGAVGGQVWKSLDDGATWVPLPGGAVPTPLADVAFLDALRGHAVGGVSTSGQSVPAIFETENGGVTWTPNPVLDVPTFVLNGVAYGSEEMRFAVGTGGKVLRHTPEAGPGRILESLLDPTPPEVPPPHNESRCPAWNPSSPAGSGWGVFEEGTLEAAGGQDLPLDATARILYEFESVPVHQGAVEGLVAPGRARVWARDLDTLCLLPHPVLIEDAAPDHIAYGPATVPVVDEAGGRLFLVYPRGPSELYRRPHPAEPNRRFSQVTDLGVAVVGPDPGRPGAITQLAAAPFPPGVPPLARLAGVTASTYHLPPEGSGALSRAKLYVVLDYSNLTSSGNFQPGSTLVFLLQADVEKLTAGDPVPFDWVFPIPSCGRTPTDPLGAGRSAVVRAGRYVAVACAQGRIQGGSTTGSVGGVARVELDELAVPATTRYFPLDGARTDQPTLADPVSGRLFIGAVTRQGRGLAGFDVARGAWFGAIPDERVIGMLALNRQTGRLYLGAGGDIIVSDARSLDLPQGKPARTPIRSDIEGRVQKVEVFQNQEVAKGDTLVVIESDKKEVPVLAPLPGRVLRLSVRKGEKVAQGDLIADLGARFTKQTTATSVDPKHGRLFTIGAGGISVLRDPLSLDKPSTPPDPDDLTRDIEEVEGLTGRTFSGGGQAYGVRVRWVNGSRGVRDHSEFCGTGPAPGPFNRPGLSYCPHTGTRELTLAQVPGADLADSEASAEAVGAEHDGAGSQEGTDRDLATLTFEEPDELLIGGGSDSEEPDPREQLAEEYRKLKQENAPDEYDRVRDTRRANTVPNRWPYRRVACAVFGASPQEDVASSDGAVLTVPTGPGEQDKQTVPATFSSSSVTCNQQGGVVAAGAVFGQQGQASSAEGFSFIDAGSTRTSAISYVDPVWGLVSQVKAEVTGLRLAHPDQGEVLIGLLRTVAETRASGRPDPGAGGSFERHIEDVWFKRKGDTEPQRLCDQCDPEAVVSELNRLFGTRAHFDLPSPDPARIEGTPGGAEAVVTRHPQEQASDIVTNEESVDRREVPGLLVTVYADELTGFSRYIVQVAGAAADSKYAVFCLYGDRQQGGCNPAPEFPDGPLPPAIPSPFERPSSEVVGSQTEVVAEGGDDRGGELAFSEHAASSRTPSPSNGVVSSLVRRIVEGFRFLINSLTDALRSAGLWTLFAGPLVIYVRRRWLPAPPARGD